MWFPRLTGLLLTGLLGMGFFSCAKEESPPPLGGGVRVGNQILYPPGFLRAKVNPQGGVVLDWNDPNEGEAGYIVERRLPNTSSWNLVTTVAPNVTRAIDTRTREKLTYFYRVLAYLEGVTVPSGEVRVTIPDLLPPNTVLLFTPPPRVKDRFVTFFFQANEATQKFICTLDGQVLPCSYDAQACLLDSPLCIGSFTQSYLGPGPHSFTVKAVDLSGKEDPTPASYDWVIDDDPPVLIFTQAPSDPSDFEPTQGRATYTFSANKPAVYFCQRDDDPVFPCSPSTPVTITFPREPQPRFSVTVMDEAGNRRRFTHTFRYDLQPPTLTLNSPSSFVVKPNTLVTIQFTTSDDIAVTGTTCTVDANTSPCSSPYTLSRSVEGDHPVTITVWDLFQKNDTKVITLTIDATPPALTFTSTPDPSTSVSFLRYHFGVTNGDVVAQYYCQFSPLDPSFSPCPNPYDRFRVPPGSYTLTVTAVDRVGNESLPITHNVSVSYPSFSTNPCVVQGSFLKVVELQDLEDYPDVDLCRTDGNQAMEDRLYRVHTGCIKSSLKERIAFQVPASSILLASPDRNGIFERSQDTRESSFDGSYLQLPPISSCGILDTTSTTFSPYTSVLGLDFRQRSGYLVGAYNPQPPPGFQYLGFHDILGFSPANENPHLILRLHHPEADQFPYAGSTYTLRFLVDAWISPAPSTFALQVSFYNDLDPQPVTTYTSQTYPWFSRLGAAHGTEILDLPFTFPFPGSPPCTSPPYVPYVEVQAYALGGACGSSYPPPQGCLDRIRVPVACP